LRACPWPGHDGNVPPRAQAAHQQASTLSKSIVNRLQGGKLVKYVYLDYGSLVALGKYTTVGNLMGNLMDRSVSAALSPEWFICPCIKCISCYTRLFRTAMLTLSNLFRRSAHATIKMH